MAEYNPLYFLLIVYGTDLRVIRSWKPGEAFVIVTVDRTRRDGPYLKNGNGGDALTSIGRGWEGLQIDQRGCASIPSSLIRRNVSEDHKDTCSPRLCESSVRGNVVRKTTCTCTCSTVSAILKSNIHVITARPLGHASRSPHSDKSTLSTRLDSPPLY